MPTDVIVPVYTRDELTERMAYESLAQLKERSNARVIVIDNGWPEDRDLPCDEYVRLEENHGYAGGVNAGLALTDSEVIVVSSIDVFVPPGWLPPLASAAVMKLGIASPEISDLKTGCDFWGGIFAMPRTIYERIGGLDEERFRLRFSDTDYAVRAAKAGYWVGRVPEVVVEHRDPSMSTLFMPEAEVAAEFDRLQQVHGAFDVYAWKLERWR